MILHLIDSLVSWTFIVWQRGSILKRIGRFHVGALEAIRAELHPFRWALCIAAYALTPVAFHRAPDWHDYLIFGLTALQCWLARHDNDDDDRWKRRKQKLADQVAEIGGRLAIVPTHA